LTNAIKKRCIAFVISDFMDKDFEKSLRIANGKHDLVAVRIYDRRETELPNIGMAKVFNKESGRSMWVDTNDPGLRSNFRTAWLRHEQQLAQMFKRTGIDATTIATGENYVKPLMSLFKVRESRY
jgi:hypothetical protein